MDEPKTRKVARDSGTGEFVSLEYAEANPQTTQIETVEVAEPDEDEEATQ